MRFGRSESRSVSPRCPACPPGRLPDGRRRPLVRFAHGGFSRGRARGVMRVLRHYRLQLGVAALEAEVMPLEFADLSLEPLIARL